jgi:L-lactate dehydrogenase complex protein LldE
MRVALFITCLADTLFPETGRATVRLLERLGHEVDFPEEQTCCGQMHFNTGYMVREGYERLAASEGDEALVAEVAEVAPRVLELSEFLVGRLGVEDVGAYYPHRVTYHPTCHSLRALRVGDAPLRLLRAVRGIDLVALPEAEECCGFGGTFAVKNADTSIAILSDKLQNVLSTRAEACTALDSSCLMHIGGGLSRQRAGVRAVHLAEILASTEASAA